MQTQTAALTGAKWIAVWIDDQACDENEGEGEYLAHEVSAVLAEDGTWLREDQHEDITDLTDDDGWASVVEANLVPDSLQIDLLWSGPSGHPRLVALVPLHDVREHRRRWMPWQGLWVGALASWRYDGTVWTRAA